MYAYLVSSYGDQKATGPLRNMLPVDRRAPLPVAMAEWSFHPKDIINVINLCKTYFTTNLWPNIPVEIELTKTDHYYMSSWNWGPVGGTTPAYIVKFNFMYLVEFLDATGKTQIMTHLKGLWDALVAANINFKSHWGKINFLTSDYVTKHYQLSQFLPYIQKPFVNDYVATRLGLTPTHSPAPSCPK